MAANKPQAEGFYWYRRQGCDATVVYVEYRPSSGELYAFTIGFEGGTPVWLMDGEWWAELVNPWQQGVGCGEAKVR